MRFVLENIETASDLDHRRLDRIVDRAADGVHKVEIRDADALHASPWYLGARPTIKKLLTTIASAPVKSGSDPSLPHSRTITVGTSQDLIASEKIAYCPLTILVEDREADGTLLDIVVDRLGSKELRDLWNSGAVPPAIEYETAGGITSIPQRIERHRDDARRQERSLRLFVLCDSDDRWPGDSENQSRAAINTIQALCVAEDVPLHVLKKRNAENYVPDSVFVAARDDPKNRGNVERFDALLRRSFIQRDHFPLKDGLKAAERDGGLAVGHYDPADEPDLRLLEERLFPKRPRLLLRLQAERGVAFTAEGLVERDGCQELEALLAALTLEV